MHEVGMIGFWYQVLVGVVLFILVLAFFAWPAFICFLRWLCLPVRPTPLSPYRTPDAEERVRYLESRVDYLEGELVEREEEYRRRLEAIQARYRRYTFRYWNQFATCILSSAWKAAVLLMMAALGSASFILMINLVCRPLVEPPHHTVPYINMLDRDASGIELDRSGTRLPTMLAAKPLPWNCCSPRHVMLYAPVRRCLVRRQVFLVFWVQPFDLIF